MWRHPWNLSGSITCETFLWKILLPVHIHYNNALQAYLHPDFVVQSCTITGGHSTVLQKLEANFRNSSQSVLII
uniref:Uncharacterized protein n=1 Tax=Anguilla anguilla TaxID=7936 RepID=A0A0E9V1H1_ANGAN